MNLCECALRWIAVFVLGTMSGTLLAEQPNATGNQAMLPNGRVDLNLPAQPLERALAALSQQTGIGMIFSSDAVARDLQAPAIQGTYTAEEALKLLLAESGLRYQFVNTRTVAIHPVNNSVSATQNSTMRLVQSETPAGSSAAAQGQQTDDRAAAASDKQTIEEIVVTAQKRVERLQDVPVSVTALTGENLQRTGADQFEEYIGQIAGAFYADAGQGRSRINMRGLQTTPTGLFEEGQSPTAIYIDDLPSLATSNPWAQTDMRLYDIERVEVLRGPQGTLFGSGALGGALRILTKKPDLQEFDANMEAGLETTEGGDESWSLSSMVNIPLVRDKLAVRVVGYYRNDGGWVENSFRNEENVNSNESKGGRFLVAYKPTDDLSMRLTVTHQQDFSDDKSIVDLNGPSTYHYSGWNAAFTDTKLTSYNLNVEYSFGPVLLTSSSTYADGDVDLGQGIGKPFDQIFGWRDSPDDTVGEHNRFPTETFAQELRLTSQTDSRFQWVLGGFYMDQDVGQDQHWYASTVWDVTGSTTLGAWSVPANSKQKAAFGEMSYKLTDKLTASAGARLFDQSFQRYNESAEGILADPNAVYPTPVRRVSETGVTPKFALSYKPNEQVMTYIQASQGFRIGQPNYAGGLADAGNGFVYPLGSKSDELWNYEVGVKSLLLDNSLRLNASVFYIDWQNIQMLRGNPLPNPAIGCCFTDNPGNATSKGVELEIEYRVNEHLTLGTSQSFTDAKLESVDAGALVQPGNRLPGTPEYWSSTYIELSDTGLIGQAEAYARLSHRYTGAVINNIDNNNPATYESDPFNVLDLRTGLDFGQYEIVLYVNNLADSDAASMGAFDPFNAGNSVYRIRPRTIGMTFRADF